MVKPINYSLSSVGRFGKDTGWILDKDVMLDSMLWKKIWRLKSVVNEDLLSHAWHELRLRVVETICVKT